ncbi:MAG: hypothetical protein MUF72_23215 [Elainella sp. Prado103]|jgi:hypothetical protein|nr:hypothetical protein [Elainella sp. Prado103]
MSKSTSSFVGTWQKVTIDECSRLYPDILQFTADQLYSSQAAPDQEFTLWDVGEYKVVSDREVKISAANDALLTYQYSLVDDRLTFQDANHCEFQYRKLP